MKTKDILAAMLLMVATCMMADNTKYLTLTTGDTEQDIPLPTVQKISFEDGKVIITTTEGTDTFPISVLSKMTFTEKEDATAIEALPGQTEDITYKEGRLAVKGDGMMRIYNTSGALVSIVNVKEGASFSLESLPAGVYVVRMRDKAIKIRK